MKEQKMGMTRTEITLKNVRDDAYAQGWYIKEEEIGTANVTAVVDTGSMSLVITEEVREKLGLGVKEERIVKTANGQRVTCHVTEAVEILWKNRNMTLPALVVPGAEDVLLGAIPLEGMDLMVNPVTQELVGIHGDKEEFILYSFSQT
jgi:clan AA aspartic protease